MKRCPKCASSFHDSVHFCEFDGAQLVADYLNSDPDWSEPRGEASTQTQPSANDALLAVDYSDSGADLLTPHEEQRTETNSLLVFIIYQRMNNDAPTENSKASPNVAVTQQQVPQMPAHPSPSASVSPSPEPSPHPIERRRRRLNLILYASD